MREIRTYGRNTASYLDRFPPVTSREPGVAKVPALLVEGLEYIYFASIPFCQMGGT